MLFLFVEAISASIDSFVSPPPMRGKKSNDVFHDKKDVIECQKGNTGNYSVITIGNVLFHSILKPNFYHSYHDREAENKICCQ